MRDKLLIVHNRARLEEAKSLVSSWYDSGDATITKMPTLLSAYRNYTELGIGSFLHNPDCSLVRVFLTLKQTAKACQYWTGEPPYTCFGPAWRGTLDYIFMTHDTQSSQLNSKLVLKSILELPSEEELSVQTALPNDFIPSDHMPIMADFEIVIQ